MSEKEVCHRQNWNQGKACKGRLWEPSRVCHRQNWNQGKAGLDGFFGDERVCHRQNWNQGKAMGSFSEATLPVCHRQNWNQGKADSRGDFWGFQFAIVKIGIKAKLLSNAIEAAGFDAVFP